MLLKKNREKTRRARLCLLTTRHGGGCWGGYADAATQLTNSRKNSWRTSMVLQAQTVQITQVSNT